MSADTEKWLRAERATEWLVRLERASPQERAEFLEWIRQSPLHVEEMLLAKLAQTVFVHLFRDCGIGADTFTSRAANVREIGSGDEYTSGGVKDLLVAARASIQIAPRAVRRSQWRNAAAIAVITLLTLITVGIDITPDLIVDTGPGEQKTVVLEDGTVVFAGAWTQISVEFTEHLRIVRLERGEALLRAAKDPQRALVVETDRSTTRVEGTVFAVSRVDPRADEITVEEGSVAVFRSASAGIVIDRDTHVTLAAGEQARVAAGGAPVATCIDDVQQALSWVDGWLHFDHETVAQAAKQFNFRNRRKITIAGRAVGERQVRGSFRIATPGRFVDFLERNRRASVVRDDWNLLLLEPRSANDRDDRAQDAGSAGDDPPARAADRK